ncbi:PAAR domain-containing protein [Brucella tritici]|uniref:Uncharacterized protein n=1 Tax=Brucella tritici TaxID=94626 RepID=A0A6L3YVT0_9HYPH|nr:hypothetical protein F9L08_03085 [Brucella tritici]
MPGIALVGVDAAGGQQQGMQVPWFRVNGNPVAVRGDSVSGHGLFPHNSPVMAEGSPSFRAGGIPVCRAGHLATCGHPTTGRSYFRIP